jgi:hypothetical protein
MCVTRTTTGASNESHAFDSRAARQTPVGEKETTAFVAKRLPLMVPLFLLIWFFGGLLEAGDLGSSDVAYRLQAAHSLWTSDPQVYPTDPNRMLPIGRDGQRKIPWGIGQSLVMLPADVVSSAVASFLDLPEPWRARCAVRPWAILRSR